MRTLWTIVKKDLLRFRWPLRILACNWLIKTMVWILLYYWKFNSLTITAAQSDSIFDIVLNGFEFPKAIVLYFKLENFQSFPFQAVAVYVGMFMEVPLLIYIITNALKEDSAFDEQTFWITRPISRSQMLAAKSVFIGLVAFLLPIVLQTGMCCFKAVTVSHYYNYYSTNRFEFDKIFSLVITQANWVVAAMLLATLWKNQTIGSCVLALLLFLLVFIPKMYFDRDWSPTIFLTITTFWLASGAVIFAFMYARRNRIGGYSLLSVAFILMITALILL